jgi:hypothetical protein
LAAKHHRLANKTNEAARKCGWRGVAAVEKGWLVISGVACLPHHGGTASKENMCICKMAAKYVVFGENGGGSAISASLAARNGGIRNSNAAMAAQRWRKAAAAARRGRCRWRGVAAAKGGGVKAAAAPGGMAAAAWRNSSRQRRRRLLAALMLHGASSRCEPASSGVGVRRKGKTRRWRRRNRRWRRCKQPALLGSLWRLAHKPCSAAAINAINNLAAALAWRRQQLGAHRAPAGMAYNIGAYNRSSGAAAAGRGWQRVARGAARGIHPSAGAAAAAAAPA